MNLLKERLAAPRPPTFFIYGPPGVWKTSLASHFADPLFICDDKEDGIVDLIGTGDIKVKDAWFASTFSDFTAKLTEVISVTCKTVVIETLAGWESMMYREVFEANERKYKSDFDEFMAFNRGPRSCAERVNSVIAQLQCIRASGKIVVMTGHSREKIYRNPVGSDFDKILPESCKETWTPLSKWFANILYLSLDFTVEDTVNMIEKPKAHACGDRALHCNPHPAFEAKNRFHFPDTIEFASSKEGYTKMAKLIKEAKKQ